MSDYDSVNDEHCMCRTREAVAEGGVGGCGERSVCRAEGGVIRRPPGLKLGRSASHWLPLACLSLIWPFGNGKIITSLHKVMMMTCLWLPNIPHTLLKHITHHHRLPVLLQLCKCWDRSCFKPSAMQLLHKSFCFLALFVFLLHGIFIYTVDFKMSFLVYACLCFFLVCQELILFHEK